jgi:hypothetical protein
MLYDEQQFVAPVASWRHGTTIAEEVERLKLLYLGATPEKPTDLHHSLAVALGYSADSTLEKDLWCCVDLEGLPKRRC